MWITSWTASPQPLWQGDFPLPTGLPFNFLGQTLRQSLRLSVGGGRLRIALSNEYGRQPLHIGGASVGLTHDGHSIVPGTLRALHFGSDAQAVIPPGAPLLSDPIELEVPPLATLAVSLYLPRATAPSTFHWDARRTTHVGEGDQSVRADFDTASTLSAWLFIRDVQVETSIATRTIVAIGDSTTDGNGASIDQDRRWTDALAEQLQAPAWAVLNAGISGGRLLRDRMGVNALARYDRDVLAQPNLTAIVVLLGINDITWPGHPFAPDEATPTLAALSAGLLQLIERGRMRGAHVIGATLTPFEGALPDTPFDRYYRPQGDALRRALNDWIRTSGAFDAVVDFDAALLDPQCPTRLYPPYDSGDHLHPGDAGNRRMAELVAERLQSLEPQAPGAALSPASAA
ncbi:SGNH/GDSL hydrolase family protein [Solimonas marina]|uniref:SGNH/GDSL hydrolase family protein n=1 Tax=Solimonas marina TaxID=2714601 RepID=A0A969WBY9_9GAMM|nr:SGNH/GDSL hydrolase family protein [Solimonas marina]NKF22050.1 SGNH/GDSL hydrolase family protein [Solimonas marina]